MKFFVRILAMFFLCTTFVFSSESKSIEQKVSDFVKMYAYKDISVDTLKTIAACVEKIQQTETSSAVQKFCFSGIGGVFYRLPSQINVLYFPKESSRFLLGSGSHKIVYKALLFKEDRIDIVAAARADDTVVKEADMFRKLSSHWSSDPFFSFFSLSSKSHILVLKYYNMGSLHSLRNRWNRFTIHEKLSIAKDAATALFAIHQAGFAHRDLHNGNILIEKTKSGRFKAGLIDLARTIPLHAYDANKAQGAVSRNPPEVLIMPFHKVPRASSDVYALGCCFFSFFFHKSYPGTFLYDIRKFSHMSQKEKRVLYDKVQKTYEEEWKNISPSFQSEPFKKTILCMIHPDPQKRIALSDVLESLDHILNKRVHS